MQRGKSIAPQRGFALVGVIAALFILAIGTQRVVSFASEETRRAHEDELLRVGKAYVDAIRSYYLSTPGTVKRYPARLEDLLEDRRLVTIQRHIRTLYADPVLGSAEWGLIAAPDGGIVGVYSRSEREPLRAVFAGAASDHSATAKKYSDWKFVWNAGQ